MTNGTTKLPIHSLVISHLEYCNSLLIGLPLTLYTNPSTGLHSRSSTPLYQSLHWPPFQVFHPSLPIPPLASIPGLPPLSTNPSTGLTIPGLPPLSTNSSTGLHSVSSTPLCQSLHWPPFSVLHPSLPIPPLAFTQCPPPISANPSTGLHSVSSTPLYQSLHWPPFQVFHPSLPIPPHGLHSVFSTPLYQSLHWPPFSVLHPSLPIPSLASIQCPPPLSANPSTGRHSVSSTPLCQSLLHWPPFSVLHPSMPIPPLAAT
ncbi:unnamed protein product, partial [Staurois parvus]